MGTKRYIFFQPNAKDCKNRYGDCTIRALCKVMEVDWLTAFDFNHVVAVVDGKYYDTWDSGDKSMYGWYEPVENGEN